MTHKVTIPIPPGGGNRIANENGVTGTVEWSPPHDMSPAQERRRTERAEALVAQIVEILNRPHVGDGE